MRAELASSPALEGARGGFPRQGWGGAYWGWGPGAFCPTSKGRAKRSKCIATRLFCWVVALLALACSRSEPTAPSYATTDFKAGIVARAGGVAISGTEVARVMRAQDVRSREALELALRDALFAREARERLDPLVLDQIGRSTLARAVVESLWGKVRSTPPTEAEVGRWTQRKWTELDRPPAARTIHAVALVGKTAAPEQDSRARAVAGRIAAAVRSATTAAEFKDLAQAVAHEGVKVRVEKLDAVTADGRVVSPSWPPQRYDPDFARAANELHSPGDISPVLKTRFGYHVIFLIERLAEKRVPYPKRLEAVREDVYRERGDKALKQLIEERNRAAGVEIRSSAEELMRQVEVDE